MNAVVRGVFAAAAALALAGCSGSTTQAGGLELLIGTNLPSADFDAVSLEIQQQSGQTFGPAVYQATFNAASTTFPTSFAIHAGTSSDQTVLIQLAALKNGNVVDLRVVQAVVPTNSLAELQLILSESCYGQVTASGASKCMPGESCQPSTGTCGSNVVSTLPAYTPDAQANSSVGDFFIDSGAPNDAKPPKDAADAGKDAPADVTIDVVQDVHTMDVVTDVVPPVDVVTDVVTDAPVDAPVDAGAPSLTLSPSTLQDFMTVVDGTISSHVTFTVKNVGTAATTAAVTPGIGGTDSTDFNVVTGSSTCTAALAPMGTCTFDVVFAPPAALAAGTQSATATATVGTLTASTDIQGENVLPSATLTLLPMTTNDFGNVEYGVTSSPLVFVLTNTGNVTTDVPGTPSTDVGDFVVSNNGCTAALAPMASCNISVTFTPGNPSLTSEQAGLSITVDPAGMAAETIKGEVVSDLSFSGSGAFPTTQTIGVQSSSIAITLNNTGPVQSGTPVISFTNQTGGSFTETNTCSSPLAATTGTCTVNVKVTPSAASASATLNALATPGGPASIAITASAENAAVLSLSPTMPPTLAANAGQAMPLSQTFTVTNTAATPAFASGTPTVQLAGANDFAVGTNSCTGGVSVGTPCSFTVVYNNPATQTTTPESTTVSVTATPGATTALTADLSGTSTGMTYAPTPFGFTTLGQSQTFTLTNNMAVSTDTLGAASLVFSGNATASDFAVTMDGCMGMTLMAGGTCQVVVQYTPMDPLPLGATLTTESASIGGSASATVTGN